jgi:hypothetical protein
MEQVYCLSLWCSFVSGESESESECIRSNGQSVIVCY